MLRRIGMIVGGVIVGATVILSATPAVAKRRAYNDGYGQQRPQHQKMSLWQQILKPHADEVAQLLFDGRQLRDSVANQYYEPTQQPQRRQVLADAVVKFQRAHDLDPDDDTILLELANVQFDAGLFDRAVDSYLKYREAKPEDQGTYYTYYNLGEAYVRLGRFDDAAQILERGIADDGTWQPMDRSHTMLLLGYVYMAQNRLDDAIDVYTRAAAVNGGAYAGGGGDYLVLMSLAVAYDRDEQLGRAQETLEQVKQLDPTFSFLVNTYPVQAATYPSQRYYVPWSPPADRHYWMAMIYEAQDRLPEAGAEWRAYAESVDPTYKHRAELHMKDVKARLVARAKAAKSDDAKGKVLKSKIVKPKPVKIR